MDRLRNLFFWSMIIVFWCLVVVWIIGGFGFIFWIGKYSDYPEWIRVIAAGLVIVAPMGFAALFFPLIALINIIGWVKDIFVNRLLARQ